MPVVKGLCRPSALNLFRDGMDTVQIAERLGVTEARAARMLFEERCIGRGRKAREKIHDREILMEILDVNTETGEMWWRGRKGEPENSAWNIRYAGKQAGGLNSQGYVVINIRGCHHRAHHIVWTVAHGAWPALDIDHKDGNRGNNALANLREVTRSVNLRNRGVSDRNRLGLVGVERSGDSWRARIHHDGKATELGHFKSLDDAIAARRRAETELGFHPLHGRRLAYGCG